MKLSLTESVEGVLQLSLVPVNDREADVCIDGAPVLRITWPNGVTQWAGASTHGFIAATPEGHFVNQNG